jgi:hypothetical protein
MALALAFLAILAVIVLELLWLVSLIRAELEAGTARPGGPRETLLHAALGVTLDGRLAKRREMRGRRAGRDFVVRWRVSVPPPWGAAEGSAEDVTCIEVAPAEGRAEPTPRVLAVPAQVADRLDTKEEKGAELVVAPTGHAAFDDAFALLAARNLGEMDVEAPAGAPFRAASQRAPAWASIDVLDRLVAVKLVGCT